MVLQSALNLVSPMYLNEALVKVQGCVSYRHSRKEVKDHIFHFAERMELDLDRILIAENFVYLH